MIERTIYECEHCHKKRLINKSQIKKHEEECFYNPKRKACIICGNFHYEPAYGEYHNEIPGGAIEDVPEVRECEVNYDIHLKLRHNCPLWRSLEIKEGD